MKDTINRPHPAALMYAGEVEAGQMSRREFLARSTALGLSAAAAYGLLGLTAPSVARAEAKAGGTHQSRGEERVAMGARYPTQGVVGLGSGAVE